MHNDRPPVCDHPNAAKHKGHRYYVGGKMDGQVQHLIYAHPSDYPRTFGTVLRDGQRSWYEIDQDASYSATEVVYRCIGVSKDFPRRQVTE
jgi:hypothetical protein